MDRFTKTASTISTDHAGSIDLRGQQLTPSGSPLNKPSPDPMDEIPPIPERSFEKLSISPISSRSHSRKNSFNLGTVSESDQFRQQMKQFEEINKQIREKVKSSVDAIHKSDSFEVESAVFEPDAEVSNSSIITPKPPALNMNNFSFGLFKDKSRALLSWLQNYKLDMLILPLTGAGYDDIDQIINNMKSKMPLTNETLISSGFHQPGYRFRLLAALEEEVNGTRGRGNRSNKNQWYCCKTTSAMNINVIGMPTLYEWLENLGLAHLNQLFVQAGFEDLEHNLALMNSNFPITDEVLHYDIGIEKPGYRHRILAKLQEDCDGVQSFKKTVLSSSSSRSRKEELIIDKEGQSTACEMCRIMQRVYNING